MPGKLPKLVCAPTLKLWQLSGLLCAHANQDPNLQSCFQLMNFLECLSIQIAGQKGRSPGTGFWPIND